MRALLRTAKAWLQPAPGHASIERPLDAYELAFYLANRRMIINGVIAVQVGGTLDHDRLRAALDQLQRRHAVLRVRIVDAASPYITQRDVPPIPLDFAEDRPWRDVVTEHLNTALALHIGPPVRFTLLTNQGGARSHLVASFSHAVGDGRSGVTMIRDLFASYGGQKLDTLPPAPPLSLWLSQRKLPALVSQVLGTTLDVASNTVMSARDVVASAVHTRPENTQHAFRHKIDVTGYSEFWTKSFLARCKEEDASPFGGLCSALLLEAAHIAGPGRNHAIGCATSFDLRDALGPESANRFGMYAWAPTLYYRVRSTLPRWRLARRIHNRVRLTRRTFPALASGLLLRGGRPFVQAHHDSPLSDLSHVWMGSNVVLSNIGKIDEIHSSPPIEGVCLFATVPNTDATLIGQSYRGRLCVNFIHTVPANRLGFGSHLAQRTFRRLEDPSHK